MNLLRTDYGDGASHPAVSLLGVDTGGTVWVDRDGYRLDFPEQLLDDMKQDFSVDGNAAEMVNAHGFPWDESQVDSLIREQVTGSLLLTCRDCGTRPIVERVDDRCTECGDAAEARSDEISYLRRLG